MNLSVLSFLPVSFWCFNSKSAKCELNMAKLSDLVLLRNDPVVAAEFLRAAKKGDVDAQYGMGLIYAEGRGVEQDEAKAFYWLTCAIEQGDSGAVVLRKVVAAGMSAEQFDRAKLLLKEGRLVQSRVGKKLHRRRNSKQHQTGLH
jgi:TPR repeat protein